ncbi:MAG: hypothetical protein JXA22_04830 [Candidatus Thermoplasmatota archaeon]|nr:hypothetical protein [Candidatus Thermoplasmatota archaeon]
MIGNTKVARIGIFLVMLLMLGSIFIYLPKENDEVEAIGAPAITITITQPRVTAYVAPGQDGIVTFTGKVEAMIPWDPSVQYLIVQLTADAGGWPASNPPALIFNKATKLRDFTLSVQVPVETSKKTQQSLSLTGRWNYSPGITGGTIAASTAIISVEQYYQFSVGCEKPYVQVSPGSSLGFRLRLINEGNAGDRLRVEVKNLKELADQGWTVQLSQDKFAVPEKQEKVLTVSVTTPVKWNVWKNAVTTIQLRIISAQAESLGQASDIADYSIYVRQKGVSIPGFEPGLAIIALAMISVLIFGFAKRKRSGS